MLNIGKTIILGDSYSTFTDCIPEGFLTWYGKDKNDNTDVTDVNQTWWKQLLTHTKSELVLNNSWSGSTVCNTCRPNLPQSSSFINRYKELKKNNFFKNNSLDTIFIFGGTNDNWINCPMGNLKYSDWNEEDLLCILPSFCYLFSHLKNDNPNTKIICVINTDLGHELTDALKKACLKIGIDYLQLTNISKQSGHPNIEGMGQIKDQIIAYLNN